MSVSGQKYALLFFRYSVIMKKHAAVRNRGLQNFLLFWTAKNSREEWTDEYLLLDLVLWGL